MIIKQKEWKTMKLKYISTINEETLSEDTSPYLNINYIDIGNVDSNGIIDTIATYTFSEAPSRARRIVRKGDILISTVRTYLEAITSIETDEENLIASTGFAIIRPSKTKLNQAFCRYAVKQSNFLSEVQTRSVGVSYPAINASELGNISLKVPCLKDQIEISTFLNNEILIIDALITSKTNFITLLTEKRQSLITQAATKGLNPKVKMKSTGVEWLGEVPEHWEVLQLKYITTEPLKYGANEAAFGAPSPRG